MMEKAQKVRSCETYGKNSKLSGFNCLHYVFEVGEAGERNKENVAEMQMMQPPERL